MFPIYPKKSLGQNFLNDKNIIKKIVGVGNINKNTTILEIGPGTGNLTNEILEQNPRKIYLIEKDKFLASELKKKFKSQKKILVINADILKIDERKIIDNNVTVYSNLPYNISTQVLAKWTLLNKWMPWYNCLILMFQKEVANRILAKKQTKEYGRLSILSNWRLEIKKHFDISKNCFFPKPKVNSTLLSFKPIRKIKYELKNPKLLEEITRVFFSNRRKMINKPFAKIFNEKREVNKKFKLNLKLRPEDLDKDVYYKMAKKYEELFD